MKWFTATNGASLENDHFFDQLRVAVISARHNTSLEPYMLYDGEYNERTRWLQKHGVYIIRHKLPIRTAIEEYVRINATSDLIPVRTGAYLRSEIPVAISREGIRDNYILYTDCDVVFLRDPSLQSYKPSYFAACGSREGGYTRFHLGGWMHYNSGVMIMNVSKMSECYAAFQEFVLRNGEGVWRPNAKFWRKHLFMSDQLALNLFYRGKITRLDVKYNWRPSLGINSDAFILHFNGLKWTQWDDFVSGALSPYRQAKFEKLVSRNRLAYEYYSNLAASFLSLSTTTHQSRVVCGG